MQCIIANAENSMKKIITSLFVCIISCATQAQNKILISGTISDATTNQPLPFISISLKKQLIGTVSNENGKFDLYVSDTMMNDTLLINDIGYIQQKFALNKIQSPLNIQLKTSPVMLNEVVVRPQPPEFYIKLAVLNIKNNYPTTPFVSEAYYREKVLENKNFVKCDEGIFKSYCPNYLDTIKNQHQLLLYRQEKNIQEVQFMSKERVEADEKQKKREEKAAKKGKPAPEKKENGLELDLSSSFSGLDNILNAAGLKQPGRFLDTLEFKHYKYSFAKSTFYNDREIMVIDFETKNKVDHVREAGKIYIDVVSHAFVKIEGSGDFVIPAYIKPVLFFAGYGISDPTFTGSVEYYQVQGKWYPKHKQYDINFEITKRRMFAANDNSNFEIEATYTVNKLQVENALPIPLEKQFKSDKPMETQVYNDESISWNGINIIKK